MCYDKWLKSCHDMVDKHKREERDSCLYGFLILGGAVIAAAAMYFGSIWLFAKWFGDAVK